MINKRHSSDWQDVIEPSGNNFRLEIKEIWRYRHLLRMFIWRDVVSMYSQTILGPIWFVVQPILTTFVFALVFGRFAGLSSDGQPQSLFYFSGIIIWSYFNESFMKISSTLKSNTGLLKKIYFPRLILPLTTIAASLIRFMIQLSAFLITLAFFMFTLPKGPKPNMYALWIPMLILIVTLFSLGAGMLMASFTVSYRDLVFLISFGVTLFMYITPVIYPLSTVPPEHRAYVESNPMTGIIEGFRHGLLGSGAWSWNAILYSMWFSMLVFVIGLLAFNRASRNFIDTI